MSAPECNKKYKPFSTERRTSRWTLRKHLVSVHCAGGGGTASQYSACTVCTVCTVQAMATGLCALGRLDYSVNTSSLLSPPLSLSLLHSVYTCTVPRPPTRDVSFQCRAYVPPPAAGIRATVPSSSCHDHPELGPCTAVEVRGARASVPRVPLPLLWRGVRVNSERGGVSCRARASTVCVTPTPVGTLVRPPPWKVSTRLVGAGREPLATVRGCAGALTASVCPTRRPQAPPSTLRASFGGPSTPSTRPDAPRHVGRLPT